MLFTKVFIKSPAVSPAFVWFLAGSGQNILAGPRPGPQSGTFVGGFVVFNRVVKNVTGIKKDVHFSDFLKNVQKTFKKFRKFNQTDSR